MRGLLDDAMRRGGLSARGVHKVLRVAWSVADLRGAPAPEAQDVSPVRSELAEIDGTGGYLTGIDPNTIADSYTFEGIDDPQTVLANLGVDGAIVSKQFAEDHDLQVGSPVKVTSSDGKEALLEVKGIYEPPPFYPILGAVSIPIDTFDRLYERFFLMELAVKLYACCAFLHPALDGVLALLEEQAVTAEAVRAITLRFSHSGRSMIDQNELKSHRAQYILPIGLYNRKVVLDDILFEPRDTRIQALAGQTQVVGDDDLERFYPDRYPSIVELTRGDGTVASRRVDWPKGYPQNPVTSADLERKFRDLAATALDGAAIDRIIEAVATLEQPDRVDDLLGLLARTD